MDTYTYSLIQTKKKFCPQPIWYFNSLIPLHTTNNFTEIQFSYENLTGIIIKKIETEENDTYQNKKRVCLDRRFRGFCLKTYRISIFEYKYKYLSFEYLKKIKGLLVLEESLHD